MNFQVIPKTGAPAQQPPVDVERVRTASGGDDEFEREILELYVSDTKERLELIERLVVADETTQVHREAHTIKGASASIGAFQMRELALALEREAGVDDLSRAVSRLSALRSALEAVNGFVEGYVKAAKKS